MSNSSKGCATKAKYFAKKLWPFDIFLVVSSLSLRMMKYVRFGYLQLYARSHIFFLRRIGMTHQSSTHGLLVVLRLALG